ncbi:hypothetical protein AVEN_71005-1 [Araneus ventricosus]|uniref:Uncharacterized protein n=1 Tax=Araneus ventricosus TaxID=182803 RepID=A0A4Y2G9H1_ARAVE|nr:hypothetical protein AVEN_71005-1 [Araneus ventricosus]
MSILLTCGLPNIQLSHQPGSINTPLPAPVRPWVLNGFCSSSSASVMETFAKHARGLLNCFNGGGREASFGYGEREKPNVASAKYLQKYMMWMFRRL